MPRGSWGKRKVGLQNSGKEGKRSISLQRRRGARKIKTLEEGQNLAAHFRKPRGRGNVPLLHRIEVLQ